MTFWIWVFGGIYAVMLLLASFKSYKKGRTAEDFMLAGSNVGLILGLLTFAAALFSTFTFLGMPDFFRLHGVGAWIFLAVSDGVMVFFILWFGFHIRKKAKEFGFKGVAGLVGKCYDNKWAGYFLFLSAFIFLIPYVGIQIQGISIFMIAAFPGSLPHWGWAVGIVAVMLLYSEIGGFKAIIYSDAIQGLLLLVVIWIIGLNCLEHFGGIVAMFEKIENVNSQLLSTPGPKGLFTPQFLIASLIVIVMIPVSQPQFTTRLIVMKSMKTMHLMAVSLGVFAILVITPTIFIGLYGADIYGEATGANFFSNTFLHDQKGYIAALAVIGLIAAGLSTTNAQIFALGSELRGLLKGDEKSVMLKTKVGIFIFSIIALSFSLLVIDQIAMLARLSFTGTATMAPMVLAGILSKKKLPFIIPLVSFFVLIIFLLSLAGLIPSMLGEFRLDLILFFFLTVIVGSIALFVNRKNNDKV